jgi:hypothetical protein
MSSIQFGPLVYTTIYNYFSNFSYWTNRQIPPTGKAILTQATMAAVSTRLQHGNKSTNDNI